MCIDIDTIVPLQQHNIVLLVIDDLFGVCRLWRGKLAHVAKDGQQETMRNTLRYTITM